MQGRRLRRQERERGGSAAELRGDMLTQTLLHMGHATGGLIGVGWTDAPIHAASTPNYGCQFTGKGQRCVLYFAQAYLPVLAG